MGGFSEHRGGFSEHGWLSRTSRWLPRTSEETSSIGLNVLTIVVFAVFAVIARVKARDGSNLACLLKTFEHCTLAFATALLS